MANTIRDKAVDQIINCLSDEEESMEFLDDLRIFSPLECFEIERYEISDTHRGIVLTLIGEYESCNLIVDVKSGSPSIDQVHNVIYRHGVNCGFRVIIYTGGENSVAKNDPSQSEGVVRSLVNSLNQYNKNLYLIKLSDINPWTKDMNFVDMDRPYENYKFRTNEFPSEMKFRESEFWRVYFACLDSSSYDPMTAYDDGITNESEFGYHIETEFAHIYAEWNDSGMFYHAISNEEYPSFLSCFIKSPRVKKLLTGMELSIQSKPGKPDEIIVKVANFPLNRLNYAPWNEKMAYAMMIKANLYNIQDLIEEFGENVAVLTQRR